MSILIAGIGNIFLGDDAFGSEVARRLLALSWPEDVRVVDFGIRSRDFAYALLDGHDVIILVDAVARGGPPGTLYLLEPKDFGDTGTTPILDPHTLDVVRALRLARSLGEPITRILLVGCDVTAPDPDAPEMAISEPVQAAIDEAIPMVQALVARLLDGFAATRSGARGSS
jgi:hydrogenase maturation protease